MPNNQYDIWTQIWNWVTTNIGIQPINSAIAAIVMSLLRAGFMRKKRAIKYVLLDATICASIAGTIVPLLAHLVGHTEFSSFAGTMIGFVGTEKLRAFLFKFINRRSMGNDNEYE